MNNACEQRHYKQVIQTMKIIVKRLANISQGIMSVDKKKPEMKCLITNPVGGNEGT